MSSVGLFRVRDGWVVMEIDSGAMLAKFAPAQRPLAIEYIQDYIINNKQKMQETAAAQAHPDLLLKG